MVANGKGLVNTIRQTPRLLAGVVMCLAVLSLVTTARTQEPKQRLLAEYVPSSVLVEALAPTNSASRSGGVRTLDGNPPFRSMHEPSRAHTAGDRWEQFEAEFGIREKAPSLVKGSLESAKYGLDKTVFTVNEFVQDVQDRLSFDYELRSLGRATNPNESPRTASSSTIPVWDAVENARLQSDINLDAARGRAFVGVRLVLPIGD
jgi:hypothetical protein